MTILVLLVACLVAAGSVVKLGFGWKPVDRGGAAAQSVAWVTLILSCVAGLIVDHVFGVLLVAAVVMLCIPLTALTKSRLIARDGRIAVDRS